MNQDYWQQQTTDPLFPNLIWSRPETQQGAGKLLIVGGQAQEFIHVAECYAAAEKAGVGSIRVIMPDSTRKITKMLPNIEYAKANTSGSFAKEALAELIDACIWADAVLLAGDLGKNSETSLMLESFVDMYDGLLIISNEALPSLTNTSAALLDRQNMILITTVSLLQKIGIELKLEKPIISTIGNLDLAATLHELSLKHPARLVVSQKESIWVASNGLVSLTTGQDIKSNSQIATQAAVWSMQNPSKLFEALSTAAFC